MSSYNLEEEDYELLFLKWIPNIVCCKRLNSKIFFIITAYIECLFSIYDVISGDLMILGLYLIERNLFSAWSCTGHFGGVANLFTSVLLIIGFHKDKKELIWIWLLTKELWFIETLVILLAYSIHYPTLYLTSYVSLLVLAGITLLIMLIINSYYLTLSNQNTSETSRPIAITINNSLSQLD